VYVYLGTGKSKTGARIAYLLASKRHEKVLLCGPTNTAVDTVASKLKFFVFFLKANLGIIFWYCAVFVYLFRQRYFVAGFDICSHPCESLVTSESASSHPNLSFSMLSFLVFSVGSVLVKCFFSFFFFLYPRVT